MTPAEIDLTIYQGATFRKPFQWTAGDPAVAVNLTGATARMQLRKKITSPDVLLELTTANGGILITTPLEGKFEIFITDTQTSAIDFKTAVYDLEIVDTAGQVYRILMGSVEVSPEVTRA